jgi:hypothetical protein
VEVGKLATNAQALTENRGWWANTQQVGSCTQTVIMCMWLDLLQALEAHTSAPQQFVVLQALVHVPMHLEVEVGKLTTNAQALTANRGWWANTQQVGSRIEVPSSYLQVCVQVWTALSAAREGCGHACQKQ